MKTREDFKDLLQIFVNDLAMEMTLAWHMWGHIELPMDKERPSTLKQYPLFKKKTPS